MGSRPVGAALIALALLMTWGFLRADVDAAAPATVLALLITVVLPAGGGVWLLARPGRERQVAARKDALRRQTLESEVLRLAGRRDGKLTTVEVVTELSVPPEEAKGVLDGLARRELADLEVTESGVVVYAFHDVRHLGEKGGAKGILEPVVALGFATALALWAAPAQAQVPDSVDLVVAGAWVLTMDPARPLVEDGAVAVRDGAIVAVGPRVEIARRYPARETIGGEDRVVLPGLVNGHTHAAMVLFRGLADDLDLMTWLQEYIFPMEARFVDPELVRVGVRLACWEMIRGGTTTFVDMYFYPDHAAAVVQECGLRAILGAPMIDFPSPGFEGWDDAFAAGVDFARRRAGERGGLGGPGSAGHAAEGEAAEGADSARAGRTPRVRPALAPHAPYTVSPEHYRQVLAAATELGVPITTHVAEDGSEVATIEERYGTTPILHLEALGLLAHPLIAAHVVWPSPAEIALLARTGTGVIHNPTSNLKTAAGVSPVPAMLEAGVRVGLGTDGAASNNDLDRWEEIRLAALLHKGVTDDATAVPAGTALRMATLGGAEAVGLSGEVGSLVAGKRADLIQVSLASPRFAPLYDVVSHLVYVADAQDVVTTVVDGRVLMRDGRVLSVEGTKARAAAEVLASQIRAALAERQDD